MPWIEYRFDRPSTFSSMDLKLIGWRSRSYPIRVTIDGKTVWQGETDRQLGYARISLPAAMGRRVRISQTGPSVDRDAFGKIVELGKTRKSADTGADQVPTGWFLGIFEIDFNGPPAVD